MKKMKLTGLIIVITLFSINLAWTQSNEAKVKGIKEYKLSMNSGRLIIRGLNKVEFVGYSGSGVTIKSSGSRGGDIERAEGLKLINGLGLEDNTGLGLSIEKDGDTNVVQELSKNKSRQYVFQVPKGVTIVYEHSTPYGSKVVFRDISGEIESTTNHKAVILENVTGPMTISTVHGSIDGSFSTINPAKPISIVSSYGNIDLSIPENSKVNFKIATSRGEIYSDLDLDIERDTSNMKSYKSNNVVGTLNGGGVDFQVKSNHGTIYLRKK